MNSSNDVNKKCSTERSKKLTKYIYPQEIKTPICRDYANYREKCT